MVSPTDSTLEDRERLEQFLAWRRATRRTRRWPGLSAPGWRWFGYGAGVGVLGVIFIAFASLLNGDLPQGRLGDVVRSRPADSFPPAPSLPERPSRAERMPARADVIGEPL